MSDIVLTADGGGSIVLTAESSELSLSTSPGVLSLGIAVGPTTGEANTAANVGAGAGVFRDKVGTVLNLRSVTGSGGVTVTENADEIDISTVGSSGDVTGPASSTDNAPAIFDGVTGKLIKEPDAAVDYLGQAITNVGNVDGRDVSADGAALDSHIADLANPHAVTAAQAGADPVGSAAAVQTNLTTHENDTANPHATDVDNLGAGTLAELNATITDATLDDSGDPRTPTAHATSHEDGGSDEITVEGLGTAGGSGTVPVSDGAGGLSMAAPAPAAHSSTHENGGSDEIDVVGLSGLLADDQNPVDHATDHENGGGDEIDVGGLSGLLADAQTPLSHASTHQDGGADEVAVAVAAANAIPKAGAGGTFAGGWIDDTSHGSLSGGSLHSLVVAAVSHGFMSSADKTKLDAYPVFGSLSHGSLQNLGVDDHSQYWLLAGRAGGQGGFGGTAASEELTLRGTTNANLGLVRVQSPIEIDGVTAAAALSPYSVRNASSETITGVYIGGTFADARTITFTNGFFVYETVSGRPQITSGAAPTFAAFTLCHGLPKLSSGPGFDNLDAMVISASPMIETATAQSRTCNSCNGFSYAAQTRATVAGATQTITNQIGLQVLPTFSTAAGAIANLGTIRGVWCRNPAAGLLQPDLGIATMTAYYGVDVDAIPFGGNVPKAAVRSALTDATNTHFLLNTGNAQSDFWGGLLNNCGPISIPYDLFQLTLGASLDFGMGWSVGNFMFMNFANTGPHQLRFSNPSTSRFLIEGEVQSELNLNFDRFSIGAQTGAVGNQIGAFVTPARATQANGDWADYLLTSAGNLTINHTMDLVARWTFPAIGLTAGTGSANELTNLYVEGMTLSGLGGAETSALKVLGRRHHIGVDGFPSASPTALAADADDYAPVTGISMRQVWRVEASGADRTVTGIAIQRTGDTQTVINIGATYNVVLSHQDAASSAANRIISPTGASLTLGPDEFAHLWHDDVTDRWRILETNGA